MELTRDKWPLAQDLFEQVLAQAPSQRKTFLDQATQDEALRLFVQNLVTAHEQSGTLLPEAPQAALSRIFEETATQAWEGREIGNYRIIEKIGEGGMGLVFQAKRDDGAYEKTVAVKLIRFDVSSAANKARFLTERQLMARLEHPHIARLLDGGTDGHMPFLVMEYVDGVPVTAYCDAAKLNVSQRLELFGKICSAIQVAHQNLIVHRDIKPSNILVTPDGTPKLLDFGIAKLLDPADESHEPARTASQQPMFTPSYASPEQLLGKSVTTASDVYSLGVLLFELLCGFRPFALKKHLTPIEVAATQDDPTAPSHVLVKKMQTEASSQVAAIALKRASSTTHLPKVLRGDLDAIVLKALRPDPRHRYETVAQFAEDVRCYLNNEPVWARKKTVTYQAIKFCRRHITGVSAAALLFLSLLVFLTYTHFQAKRLAKERDLAQASTRLFVDSFNMADPNLARGETVTALEILEHAEEKVDREHADRPELQASLQAAMGQVYLNLRMNDRAEPLLNKAIDAQTQMFGSRDLRLADTKESLAQLAFNQGQYLDSENLALESLRLRQDFKDNPQAIARSLVLAANARRAKGDRNGALPLFNEALILLRKTSNESSLELVNTLNALAYTLTLLSEFEKAEPLFGEALQLLEDEIAGPYPLKARILRRFCDLYLRWGDLEKAEIYLQEALHMNRKLYGEEHTRIAVNLHDWAKLTYRLGEPLRAETLYRESLAMKTKLLGDSHPGLNGTIINLATILHQEGAWSEAETFFRRALDIHHARFKQPNFNLAYLQQEFGKLLKDMGKWGEAEQLFCDSMDGFMKFSSRPKRRHAEAQLLLAETWLLQGHRAGVSSALDQCLPVFQKRKDQGQIARVAEAFAELQRLQQNASE